MTFKAVANSKHIKIILKCTSQILLELAIDLTTGVVLGVFPNYLQLKADLQLGRTW